MLVLLLMAYVFLVLVFVLNAGFFETQQMKIYGG